MTTPPTSDQLKLALDRTFAAYERTMLAWIRTAASLISFGFTLYKFFQYVREQDQIPRPEHLLGARNYGILMIVVGVITLAMAALDHRRHLKALGDQYGETPFSLSLVLAALIATLGILGLVAAILRQ